MGMRLRRDLFADFLADFQAGELGQHQVEHQEVRRGFPDLGEAGGAIAAGGDLVTVFLQVVAHQLYDVFVVFNYQNTFHLASFLGIAHNIRESGPRTQGVEEGCWVF